MADGAALVRSAAVLVSKPFNWLTHIRARFLIIRFKGFMPNLAVSVTDPISAVVIAALSFLETPVGQTIANELNTEVVNIVKWIHSRLPALPAAPPKAA